MNNTETKVASVQQFKRIEIAGCPVDKASVEEVINYVKYCIATRTICRHGFINASKVVQVQTDPKITNALSTCDLLSPDGMSVVWASQLLGDPLPERVNGTNLMHDLIALAATEGYSVFFLGAKEAVVKKAICNFKEIHPELQIAGYRNGYFEEHEEENIAEQIRQSNADILFVGFGSPQKEYWLQRWVPSIGVPFSMGVGGSFDVAAGLVKRAPVWAQNAGLEWLYRLIQEPKRMWRRYLIGNAIFVSLILKAKFSSVVHRRSNQLKHIG